MNYYHTANIRHKIKLKGGQAQTVLQVRSFLCFWNNIYGTKIDFELRPDPPEPQEEGRRIMPHINPSRMQYVSSGSPMYGIIETWDESTFDLKKRLFEIANEYIGTLKDVKEYSSELEKQMSEL